MLPTTHYTLMILTSAIIIFSSLFNAYYIWKKKSRRNKPKFKMTIRKMFQNIKLDLQHFLLFQICKFSHNWCNIWNHGSCSFKKLYLILGVQLFITSSIQIIIFLKGKILELSEIKMVKTLYWHKASLQWKSMSENAPNVGQQIVAIFFSVAIASYTNVCPSLHL